MSFESRGSRGILLDLFCVLPTVHLDDQSMPKAAEIYDVGANRMLTAKLRAFQAFCAKILP